MGGIGGIMPIGAPWGGPESMHLLSALTSCVLYDRRDCPSALYCTNGQGICSGRCNRCTSTEDQRCHESTYHCLLAISGLGVFAPHNREMSREHEQLAERALPDYIDFTLDFLGYEREVCADVAAALDAGTPVMVLFGGGWALAVGHAPGGEWIAYTGKAEPTIISGFDEAFTMRRVRSCERPAWRALNRMADVLAETERRGEDLEYAQSLTDDARFAAMGESELRREYDYAAAIIGYYAESRCFTRNALCNALDGRYLWVTHAPDANGEDTICLNDALMRAARYFQHTHDACCWSAWGDMGFKFRNPEDAALEVFRSARVRHSVAGYLKRMAQNDRAALNALRGLRESDG